MLAFFPSLLQQCFDASAHLAAGMKREAIVKANFWEVFGLNDCEQVPEAVKETALLGKEFTITNVHIRDGVAVEPDSAIHSAGGDCLFTMGFRYLCNHSLLYHIEVPWHT